MHGVAGLHIPQSVNLVQWTINIEEPLCDISLSHSRDAQA